MTGQFWKLDIFSHSIPTLISISWPAYLRNHSQLITDFSPSRARKSVSCTGAKKVLRLRCYLRLEKNKCHLVFFQSCCPHTRLSRPVNSNKNNLPSCLPPAHPTSCLLPHLSLTAANLWAALSSPALCITIFEIFLQGGFDKVKS